MWYPIIEEQALRSSFENYDSDQATRDALLYKTSDLKLQGEILSKDMNMEVAIKVGLTLEQSKITQENINSSKNLRRRFKHCL